MAELLSNPDSSVRATILTELKKTQPPRIWSTVKTERSIEQLELEAEGIRNEKEKKVENQTAQKRKRELSKMASNPTPYLRETEKLVTQRSVSAYKQAGKLLADLREALNESEQADLAEQQAIKLKTNNPTLRHLTAALRREGFVMKK